MTDKQAVQQAINRIDGILSKARFTEPILNRDDHIILVNDIKLIQDTCYTYFTSKEESEDGGTNIIPVSPATGDEDSEGSGDGV